MIAEVEILPVQFMQRAEDVKMAPIDARVYEESQKGVMRAIFKAQRLMKAEKVRWVVSRSRKSRHMARWRKLVDAILKSYGCRYRTIPTK